MEKQIQSDEMFYVDEDGMPHANSKVMPILLADWLYADLTNNPDTIRVRLDSIAKCLAEGAVFRLAGNANFISVGRKCAHINCLHNSFNPPIEVDTEELLAIMEAWLKFNIEVNPFEERH